MWGGELFRADGFGSLTDPAAAAGKRRADAIRRSNGRADAIRRLGCSRRSDVSFIEVA